METPNHYVDIKFEYENKIINKARLGGARIYKNAILLTPGEWSDSVTRAPVLYSSEELNKGHKRWMGNYLNVNHSWNVEDRIGLVRNPSFKSDKVLADLYIYPITQRSKDVIALIDAGLVNNLSVELATKDIWDAKKNMRVAKDIRFIGLAVVTDPADPNTRIK